MIDLILEAFAVVVVAIELESPATEGVRVAELAVTGPAVVLARHRVGVRDGVARSVDEAAVDLVPSRVEPRVRLVGAPHVCVRYPAIRFVQEQPRLEQALALR